MNPLEMIDMNNAQESNNTFGVTIAKVINNKDDPEKIGRVQIEFPGRGKPDNNWAWVVSPMAGNNKGFFFLPDVNDEVLVAFEHGDINQPCILGVIWNEKDRPPGKNENGENNIKMIKSRSGHVIRMDDTKGKEKIEIIDKSENNRIIIDTAENKISIISDKDIEISAPKGKLTITAKEIEVTSSTTAKIEANAGMDLEASGNITIKGAMVNIN
ncbi:MAG: phage tail protein [Candidatus Methanoperedens sp.]|nr:phage tail protein [Candidatus Methanoperedens sp.]